MRVFFFPEDMADKRQNTGMEEWLVHRCPSDPLGGRLVLPEALFDIYYQLNICSHGCSVSIRNPPPPYQEKKNCHKADVGERS